MSATRHGWDRKIVSLALDLVCHAQPLGARTSRGAAAGALKITDYARLLETSDSTSHRIPRISCSGVHWKEFGIIRNSAVASP